MIDLHNYLLCLYKGAPLGAPFEKYSP
jgi:hypothetical protein